jgi:hypothetical protein
VYVATGFVERPERLPVMKLIGKERIGAKLRKRYL